jgi:hypothetical protein
MKERVNLQEVKRLNAKMLGKEVPKEEPYLFWYTVWTFIQNDTYTTLTDKGAEDKLKQFPKMEVYYLKFPKSNTPMPGILKGKKYNTEECTSQEQESELIYMITGVKVPESDLRGKPKSAAQIKFEGLSLKDKVISFQARVTKDQEKDEHVKRIYKCLLENDPKDCLNNCKIK